jgi:hypothetical protein
MGSEKHTCPALSEHMMCEKNSLLPQLLVFCYLGIPRHFVPAKVERGGCRSHSRRLDDDFFVVEIDSFVLLHFFHNACLPFTARYEIPLILGCIIDPIACLPWQSEAVLFVYPPSFFSPNPSHHHL